MSDKKPRPPAPVNIRVKGSPGDAPGQPDEQAKPDDGVAEKTRAETTGRGKADMGSLPDE